MPDPKPTAEELHEEMAQSLLDDLEMCWASADVESVMTYFSKIALAAEAAARAEALDEAMEAVRAPHKHCMHMKCEGKHEAFRAIYELRFSGERGGEGGGEVIPETVKETVARVVRERAQRDAYALACVRKALEAAAKEADANPGRCYTEHPNELGTRVRISERIRALRAEDFVGDDS